MCDYFGIVLLQCPYTVNIKKIKILYCTSYQTSVLYLLKSCHLILLMIRFHLRSLTYNHMCSLFIPAKQSLRVTIAEVQGIFSYFIKTIHPCTMVGMLLPAIIVKNTHFLDVFIHAHKFLTLLFQALLFVLLLSIFSFRICVLFIIC